jgi:hypothetical protein
MATERRNSKDTPGVLSRVGPSAAIAGAGLGAPFMGMIGESPITKDPYYNKAIERLAPEELSALAQPGDVMLMSNRASGSTYYKVPQHLSTGAEYYHAEPVLAKGKPSVRQSLDPDTISMIMSDADFPKYTKGPNKGKPFTSQDLKKAFKGVLDSDELSDMTQLSDDFYGNRSISTGGARTVEAGQFSKTRGAAQHKMPTKQLIKNEGYSLLERAGKKRGANVAADYEDVVLMRPKKKLTSAQQKQYQELVASGAKKEYSGPMGAKAWLQDMFVPKLKGVTGRKGMLCKDHMCASLPAEASEKVLNESVVPGKSARRTLPADFLREASPYEAVGSTLAHSKTMLTPKQVLARRLALRGGIGAALAGTGLLAYNEPEALGALAVGATAPELIERGYRGLQRMPMSKSPEGGASGGALAAKVKDLGRKAVLPIKKKMKAKFLMPTFPEYYGAATNPLLSGSKKLLKSDKNTLKLVAKRNLPVGLASGLGTYALLKNLTADKKDV